MTQYLRVSQPAMLALIAALSDVRCEVLTEIDSQRQFPLDLGGADDQAIDAFMAEREELKATIAELRAELAGTEHALFASHTELDSLRGTLEAELQGRDVYRKGLRDQAATANASVKLMEGVVMQAASFVDDVKAQLAAIGVTFEAGPVQGEAQVSVDPVAMVTFLERTFAPGI